MKTKNQLEQEIKVLEKDNELLARQIANLKKTKVVASKDGSAAAKDIHAKLQNRVNDAELAHAELVSKYKELNYRHTSLVSRVSHFVDNFNWADRLFLTTKEIAEKLK